jgi:hypothetical protein
MIAVTTVKIWRAFLVVNTVYFFGSTFKLFGYGTYLNG